MLKPYNEYRYFGLPWLEEVPSHWAMMRNKNVLIEKKEVVGSSANNYLLLSLTLNGVIARDMINAKGKFPKDFNTYKVVEPGNLIFCLFDIDETPRTVGLSPLNGMITGAYDVFQPVNINGKYLYYYYLSIDNVKGLKPLYTGLRKVINIQTFLGTKLPVPPKEEQNQIVRFLDWKLAKINKLIRAKKKQIALLNEQKQAIINKAVTKGLDDTVPMKDSGIEWIGEIPQDWQITRIKNIGTAIIGLTYSPANLTDENGTLVFRSSNIKDGKIIYEDNVYVDCEIPEHLKTVAGDILICSRNGSRALVGKCAIIDENSQGHSFGAFTTVLRTKYSKFIYYILNSCILKNIMGLFSTSTINQLTTGILNNIYLPFPPLDVQTNIVKYLDSICMKFDSIIDKLKKEIDLITEYKTSLISSVVTGKIDVRDIEIPEYEADSDETIDDEIDDNLVLDEEGGEMEVE